MHPPDEGKARERVRFGTDGWRGQIARDFTFANVARVAHATAGFLLSDARKSLPLYRDWGAPYRPAANGIVVGYDTRFLSREFAWHFARVVRDRGLPVAVASDFVSTPALSHAVVDRRAACGVMFTASHNPPSDSGIKIKSEYGGSAPLDVTAVIESLLPEEAPEPRSPEGAVSPVDLRAPYLARVRRLIDPGRLTAFPVRVVADAMYGSAQGYVAELLAGYGVDHLQIRSVQNVLFGGKKPEPLEENLVPLRAVIASLPRRGAPVIGVATDGDGDRVAAMDEQGGYLDPHVTFALLLRYLITERRWRGAVVKSVNQTDMATAIAREHGLEVVEIPVGFRFAAEQILKKDVLIAAEESGSYAVRGHIPERDGVLTSLLLVEMAACAGKPLSHLVQSLQDDFGPHAYRRRDLVVAAPLEVVSRLRDAPPDRFAGWDVKGVETLDGIKLRFDEGWVLFRASGTEPILRTYCEMRSDEAVLRVLDEAERMARGELTLW